MKRILILLLLLPLGIVSAQDYMPKNDGVKTSDNGYVALTGAKIFVSPGEVIESATLFISEGNPLDMRTNQLTRAFVDGLEISLETHQNELWRRYMGKFEAASQ